MKPHPMEDVIGAGCAVLILCGLTGAAIAVCAVIFWMAGAAL